MNRNTPYLYAWIAALAVLCSQTSLAATIFKTVDENGVVGFSDTPPESDVPVETIQITVQAPQDPQLSQDNLQAMRETTDRMAADRREREERRAELRKQQARGQPQPYYYEAADSGGGLVSYSSSYRQRYRRPIGRLWWPIGGPEPEHPIIRPPLVCPPEHGHGKRPHGGSGIPVPYRNAGSGPGSAAWRPSVNRPASISMSRGINSAMRGR